MKNLREADENDERYCHIFIKGCIKEDYDEFFRATGYISGTRETGTITSKLPLCDSDECCKANLLGTDALSAVSITGPILAIALAIGAMIAVVPLGVAGAACATAAGYILQAVIGITFFITNRKGVLYLVRPKFHGKTLGKANRPSVCIWLFHSIE